MPAGKLPVTDNRAPPPATNTSTVPLDAARLGGDVALRCPIVLRRSHRVHLHIPLLALAREEEGENPARPTKSGRHHPGGGHLLSSNTPAPHSNQQPTPHRLVTLMRRRWPSGLERKFGPQGQLTSTVLRFVPLRTRTSRRAPRGDLSLVWLAAGESQVFPSTSR